MHVHPLVTLLLLLGTNCIFYAQSALGEDAPKGVEAQLVAKGDGYFVHILPRPVIPELQFGLPIRYGVLNSNAIVIHTSTETGKMQCLFISGSESARGLPMGVDWIHHATSRLLGIVVSNGRVYLLTWYARAAIMHTGLPLPPPQFGQGQYDLSVFNLSSGSKLASTTIQGELPESPPPEAYDKGPLQIDGDKITVFNMILQFDGKQLRLTK